MMPELEGDVSPTERAKEIARRVLDDGYDLLLACRDLDQLRESLPEIPDEIMNTFVGISCEVDELPIGSEREYWDVDALKLKDAEAAVYREQVRAVVEESLRQLLALIDEQH